MCVCACVPAFARTCVHISTENIYKPGLLVKEFIGEYKATCSQTLNEESTGPRTLHVHTPQWGTADAEINVK